MTHRLEADVAERLTQAVVSRVRSTPDFPKPGILFRDIMPVLAHAETLDGALTLHLHHIADIAKEIDVVVGIESRGFLFGMALATRLGTGFVPVRKPGKLPPPVVEVSYALEYGQDRLQIEADAITPGQRVLIVDDLLATGGTAAAAKALVEKLGGTVAAALFLVELEGLGGRKPLGDLRVETIVRF